jgi:putative ABC transport system permease protein
VSWLHGAAARLRLLFARRSAESRIDSELHFHIEMETERLKREQGLDHEEARRRALVTFGGVEKHRETLRDGRGAAWLSGLSLDLRLGLRMLAKHPGLTFVGVLAMSVAVTVGALAFAVAGAFNSSLPVDEGDRVVSIRHIDTRESGFRAPQLHDFADWRESLRAVEELGAYRVSQRNLIAPPPDGRPEAVRVAEMTASGFRIARVAPMLGRYLEDGDEREGASAVAVVGYGLWQQRLGGRADIVGSTVQLGAVRYTVVGVMPKGFGFPWNDLLWTPLRLNPAGYERGAAPGISVFGRLAPGVSLADAGSQLEAIGARLAAAYPRSHAHIRPRLLPYTRAFVEDLQLGTWIRLGRVVIGLLLVVIATNVAVLVYARTANRAGEMAVRTALGASRRRVVAQLFIEALVLSGVASLVGIVAAHFVFKRVESLARQSAGFQIPYWMRLDLTPGVVAFVVGLAVLAAVMIGVIPGLKATRDRLFESIKDLSGGSSMRLGRTWTTLLVAQVAVSVAALPIAVGGAQYWTSLALLDRGTPVTESFVMATPLLEPQLCCAGQPAEDANIRRARYTSRVAELTAQLEGEPGGFDVVLMTAPPGGEGYVRVDTDRDSTTAASDSVTTRAGWSVGVGQVEAEFFSAFDVRLLGGRSFAAADFAPGAPAAIVNRSFVQSLGGGVMLGRRLRPTPAEGAEAGPWWEIVGVVDDFPAPMEGNSPRPKVYLPLRPAAVYPVTLGVRARTLAPAATADRIRTVAMSVDPTLRFTPIRIFEELLNDEMRVARTGIFWLVMVTVSVVLLSAAGIYALMSFTVTRRQREIGIRAALGAGSGRVLAGILSRAMRQIGVGIAFGMVGTAILGPLVGDESTPRELVVKLAQVAAMMTVVGLVATIGPARRALRVQPTEALRSE